MNTEKLALQTEEQNKRFIEESTHIEYPNKSAHLLCWFIENIPDDRMIYKKGAENQVYFVRDEISYFKNITKIEVVSTHTSKSIKLPVYHIIWDNGIEMIVRDNFHGWKISVESPIELNYPVELFEKEGDEKVHSCYCEGFKEDWVFDSYKNNKKQFTVGIYDRYMMYTFIFLTSIQIK